MAIEYAPQKQINKMSQSNNYDVDEEEKPSDKNSQEEWQLDLGLHPVPNMIIRPFQSLLAFPSPSTIRRIFSKQHDHTQKMTALYRSACIQMADKIREILHDDSDYTRQEGHYSHIHTAAHDLWRKFVRWQIAHMIECERQAWALDYFVFYRVVGPKYALYEFNTLMLNEFFRYDDADIRSHHHNNNNMIMCVPSLVEDFYCSSLSNYIQKFATYGFSDIHEEGGEAILSVNNALIVNKGSSDFRYLPHVSESCPLFFYSGYDGSYYYKITMRDFLVDFLNLSKSEAQDTVEQIFDLYKTHSQQSESPQRFTHHTGHALQICIPRAALDRFVYPSVAYGHPVVLVKEKVINKREGSSSSFQLHIYPKFLKASRGYREFAPENHDGVVEEVTLAEFLRSSDLGCIQSRILAHPNLFLKHGAVTNVFHGNPQFNAHQFRSDLAALLAPYIQEAHRTNNRYLKYNDFL